MPLIKNTDLLNQFENDAAIWIHSRAVPPLIVQGGTPERPYSTPQMTDLMTKLAGRTAATMIFAKADVTFKELATVASDLNIQWWIDYLLMRRFQALGVPPMLMGMTERGGGATADVLLHDFSTRVQILQEFIADPIEEYIFKPLIKANFGEDEPNAKIIWKPVIEEDRNMRSQRLIQLLQGGAISVNECRREMGFEELQGEKYNEVTPREPGTVPGGFPRQLPSTLKVPEPTPESRMKMEEPEKTEKVDLVKIEKKFREKMLELTKKAKEQLSQGKKLTKDIKKEIRNEAKEIINQYVVASYLGGRVKANVAMGKEDDLKITQKDMEPIARLKRKFTEDFENIFNDMVKVKERKSED